MSRTMAIIKKVYRQYVPISVRSAESIHKIKARLLGHNWIYSKKYFEYIEGPAARSADTIANSILNEFRATSVIDVGCGTGALLEALRNRGCQVSGLEYSDAALEYCRARRLDVAKFDLERDVFGDNTTFDVAVSMEVAEHLPDAVADRYVGLLTRLSRVVVFTAAPPGQGGRDHVNEQPPSYWIAKFQQRGLEHAVEISARWRRQWRASGNVENWYYKNLIIFQRT